MSLTTKQIQIMTIVCRGNTDHSEQWCDLDQVLERLKSMFNWATTKQSLQFSIRALIKQGMIEKAGTERRRGRRRIILAPTELGKHIGGTSHSASVVENTGENAETLASTEFEENTGTFFASTINNTF